MSMDRSKHRITQKTLVKHSGYGGLNKNSPHKGLDLMTCHQGVTLFEMAERWGLFGESTSLPRMGSEVSKYLSKFRVSLLVPLPADPGVKP